MKFIKTYANLDAYNNDNKKPYPNTLYYIEEGGQVMYDLDIINISDPEVRRILTTDFGLPIQGEGFYREDIQSITDLGESFTNNELIETFDEFKYFTGVTEFVRHFSGCINLRSLKLPDSLIHIESGSFRELSSLIELIIPNSVTTINPGCFSDLTNLETLIIGNGVEYLDGIITNCPKLDNLVFEDGDNPLTIGWVMNGSNNLKLLNIPSRCIAITDYFIQNNTNLETLIIEDSNSNTVINNGALYNLSNLKEFYIGSGVTELNGVKNYPSLETLTIAPGNTPLKIVNSSLSDMNLITDLIIPNRVLEISQGSFYNLPLLKTLKLEGGVLGSIITDSSISSRPSLEVLIIGPGFESIEGSLSGHNNLSTLEFIEGEGSTNLTGYTLRGLPNITNILLPSWITNIEDAALTGLTGLTAFDISEDNPSYSVLDGVLVNKTLTELVRYPLGNITSDYTIPSSITSIDEYCFEGSENINNIIFESETPLESVDWITKLPETISFYVPDASVDTYKAATGWITFEDKIYSMSELPE